MNNKKTTGIFAVLTIFIVGFLLFRGKDIYTGNLFPSKVTVGSVDEETQATPTEDHAGKDYNLFSPIMFYGKWILKEGKVKDSFEMEDPKDPDSLKKVDSMPEELVFGYDAGTDFFDPSYKPVFSNGLDYDVMRASFKISGKKASSLLEIAGIFDINGSSLALGLLPLNGDKNYENQAPMEVDVTEIQYDIDWKGSVLTLSYKDSKASYVPSRYEEYPEILAEEDKYFLGQPSNPDMDFHSFLLGDEGSGMVNTIYDIDIPMTYKCGKDGSFQVTAENGQEWIYKEFMRSDHALILRKKDKNLVYSSKGIIGKSEYGYKYMQLYSCYVDFNETSVSGLPGYSVGDAINSGFILSVDGETVIPPATITEEFKAGLNGVDIKLKACNISDIPLPLSSCIICWTYLDMKNNTRFQCVRYDEDETDTLSYGDSMEDIMGRYDNLVQVDDNHLVCTDMILPSRTSEITDQGGNVVFPDTNIEKLRMDFGKKGLEAMCLYIPAYNSYNMDYNMDWTKVDALKTSELLSSKALRSDLAQDITEAFENQFQDRFVYHPDSLYSEDELLEIGYSYGEDLPVDWSLAEGEVYKPTGTILIPWGRLFIYGKAELSEEGKKLLDEVYLTLQKTTGQEKYTGYISDLMVASYMSLSDKKTAYELTQSRADAVCNYLKTDFKKKYPDQKGNIPGLIAKGFGISNYLSIVDIDGNTNNFIQLSVNLAVDPDHVKDYQEADLPEKTIDDGHYYMDPDQEELYGKGKAFAEKYEGKYEKRSYSISGLDLKWKLPDQWHFGNDDELRYLNSSSAATLLNNEKSIYVMCAYSDNYRSMAHIRLYPGEIITGKSQEEEKDVIEAMHQSILTTIEEYGKDIKEELKIGKKEDGEGYQSIFSYKDEEKVFERRVTYKIKKDALAVITEIVRQDEK